MNLKETPVKQEILYTGRIIRLRRDEILLPDGKPATREVIEHPGGVGVVPLTERGEVLLVRQFRYPYGEETLEIPAGKRDPGEDPFETGKRELREETGATAATYRELGQLYPTPGYCGEIIYMYAAKDLSFGETDPDEDEFLQVVKMPLETAVEKVLSGEIKDSKTQAALLKCKILRDRGLF